MNIPPTRHYDTRHHNLHSHVSIQYISPSKGFGLIATSAIPAGTKVVIDEPPFAHVLDPFNMQSQLACTLCSTPQCAKRKGHIKCACGVPYCSRTCKIQHEDDHRMLCTAPLDANHPLVEFKQHAIHTNVVFLAAAKIVVSLILRPAQTFAMLGNFVQPSWYEAVVPPLDEDPEEFVTTLKELAEHSRSLLKTALLDLNPKLEPSVIEKATESSLWFKILGCFEQNQFEIYIDATGKNNNDAVTSTTRRDMVSVRSRASSSSSSSSEDDSPSKQQQQHGKKKSRAVTGSGLFPFACTANHSCDPNAMAMFTSNTNSASLILIRDVDENEEICISYVDPDLAVRHRQEILRDYGFQCTCDKCIEQQQSNVHADWAIQQEQIAKCVREEWSLQDSQVKLVGGVDVSFVTGTDDAIACLVVLTWPELDVVYEAFRDVKMTIDYMPGFLAFREADFILALLTELKTTQPTLYPQLLFIDGCGVLHPRQCGVACHVGVKADIATIGVSKKLLAVDGLNRDDVKTQVAKLQGMSKDKQVLLLTGDSGRVWGAALRASNPIFVSVGHKIDLPTSIRFVQMATLKFRIPEPIRQADLRSREMIRKR